MSRLGHCQSVKMLEKPEKMSVDVLLVVWFCCAISKSTSPEVMLRRRVYEKLDVFRR